MFWAKLLTVVITGFLVFWLIVFCKKNPNVLSKENWSKSFFSMGILALILIGFIALCAWWLRVG